MIKPENPRNFIEKSLTKPKNFHIGWRYSRRSRQGGGVPPDLPLTMSVYTYSFIYLGIAKGGSP